MPAGHIGVWANVTIELGHVALAEAHYFALRTAFGIEIRTTLAPTDPQIRQAVFQDLLKAQKLDNPQIH